MRLKSHLQYERNFCNLMQLKSYHAERVAASGRRKGSVCDAVLFTPDNSYLVEIKSTKAKSYSLKRGLHGLVEQCVGLHILPLVAVYFKSSHSSQGAGHWVIKIITDKIERVNIDDESDRI